ncbi:unnamed protein product [Cercopithifilaria johnstoni]|uniref:Uncharacterized protein n=1 Tax=Cercopithifilaria johnstoni TaxID=2874296 RepID=A0A8J2Q7H1_9BILA|nr:unnamed protein product [Cercopithifilaria johnstoni]
MVGYIPNAEYMVGYAQSLIRGKRCICISIGCGCYQPSGSGYRQPLLPQYRQSIYRQQPNAAPCVTNCFQDCMRNHQRACQQSCQNSCGIQTGYQQPRVYTQAPYQYEPLIHEVAKGQQSGSGACINVCMPSCESQCIQKSTPVPVVPQHNSPIPVVQSQTPFYYPSQQNEPEIQQYSNNDNILCIHLCMPSCESQCIERTTPAVPSYAGQTEQPNDIYYPKPTPYSSFTQPNQTPIVIRPQHYSGVGGTICIPICMPSCQTHCTENQGQNGGGEEYISSSTTHELIGPTQTDLQPREISISLPQSIQQSPDCMNLCQEMCMQQCVGQNQEENQCRPSCYYTCQESCAHSPINTGTVNSFQQRQIESEIYETTATTLDNSMNFPLLKTFLLRSPPYYRQTSLSEPQVINCLSGSRSIGQCKCPSGYATCSSTNSRSSQQQCCRKRRKKA